MSLTKEKKKTIISDYKREKQDTGSAEVQAALLTARINSLSEHFKTNVKDRHSRHGLIKMVSRRKRLLHYLNLQDPARYKNLITRLELRK